MLSINNSEEFVNQHSILLKTTLYRFLYKYVSPDQEFRRRLIIEFETQCSVFKH